ncbi:MAG: TolC family protein, partial [Calditrichaceae bacterium]|nr:TolC family protein [Calditrichaceae bacterium]
MFNFKQIQFLAGLLFIVFVMGTAVFAQEAAQVLSLEDCINIALEKNSTLRVSRLSDEAADKDVLGSYSGILPSISASASKGKTESGIREYLGDVLVGQDSAGRAIFEERVITQAATERESNNAALSVNQNIFDGGIWWNSIRKAKTDKKSAEYSLLSAKNDVILQVEQAYFNLNKQIKLLEVYEVAVKRSQGQLDRTEKMYELGATAQLDVFQSRVNLGNDRISLLQQKNAVDQAKKNLNLVMGRDPFTPLQVSSEINLEIAIPESNELILQAFDNQPEIMKNKSDIKSRELSISMAKGQFYPRIYGRINYSRDNEDLSRVYSNYSRNYSINYGIGISLDIFSGFSDYVSVQKAKIAEKTAKENFEEYKRNLASEIEQY